ncbi:MAG: DUF4476 domain-containing protein [Bradymonadia bacterium]
MIKQLSILAALIIAPQIASAAPPAAVFEAPDLRPRAARQIEDPIIVDRQDLRRDIRGMIREIHEMQAIVDQLPRGMGLRPTRRALKRQISQMEARLAEARADLQQAPSLTQVRQYGRRHQPAPVYRPVSQDTMQHLVQRLRDEPFRSDQMRIIRRAANRHHFTARQAVRLAKQLSFSGDRVDALAVLYPSIVDPQNDHVLYAALDFHRDRKALDRKLTQAGYALDAPRHRGRHRAQRG